MFLTIHLKEYATKITIYYEFIHMITVYDIHTINDYRLTKVITF